jgi:hypothetical protein
MKLRDKSVGVCKGAILTVCFDYDVRQTAKGFQGNCLDLLEFIRKLTNCHCSRRDAMGWTLLSKYKSSITANLTF